MFFAIFAEDVANSTTKRMAVREAHLARIKLLADANRVLLAGSMLQASGEGFSGSLIVAEFDSQSEAEAWLADDPYIAAGVFARTQVKPFKKVLP